MLEYVISAWRNLGRKKFRSVITISGIIIGVASVIIIGAIGNGATETVSSQLDSLGINGINIAQQKENMYDTSSILTDSDLKTCKKIPEVKSTMPLIMQAGNAVLRGKQKNALLWGIDSNAKSMISIKVVHGRMFSKSQVISHAKVCLINDTFASEVYKRTNVVGKDISLFMGNDYETFKICGIVESDSSLLYNFVGDYIPTFVYLPYTAAEDLRFRDGFDQIMIKSNANIDMDKMGNRIITALADEHYGNTYTFTNMLKQKHNLTNIMNIITLVVAAVGAISLVVAGLGIMTVLLVSINERTKEIGIKKAIGAKKKDIMFEFLFEALFISIIGAALGILDGSALSFIISKFVKLNLYLNISSIIYSVTFALATGIIFGVYPAYKAANLKPVDALRQE